MNFLLLLRGCSPGRTERTWACRWPDGDDKASLLKSAWLLLYRDFIISRGRCIQPLTIRIVVACCRMCSLWRFRFNCGNSATQFHLPSTFSPRLCYALDIVIPESGTTSVVPTIYRARLGIEIPRKAVIPSGSSPFQEAFRGTTMATPFAVTSGSKYCRSCGGDIAKRNGILKCWNETPKECKMIARDGERKFCELCGKPDPGGTKCRRCGQEACNYSQC